MQFRHQCRLHDIRLQSAAQVGDRKLGALMAFGLVGLLLSAPAEAQSMGARLAQLGPNPGNGPSYGYQPYNDRNPTGFYHPHGMGFGHYYLTQKHHGPRFRTFRYRKFRGA